MKRKMVKNIHSKRHVLSDDACTSCGKPMKEAIGILKYLVNGEEVKVPNISHLSCTACHEIVIRLDEVRELRQRALELYRQRYGLLSAHQIRSLRVRLDLTQQQLSTLLQLGMNTLSRWESGRNVQTAAMDMLLRLVRDIPQSIDYLKKHAA